MCACQSGCLFPLPLFFPVRVVVRVRRGGFEALEGVVSVKKRRVRTMKRPCVLTHHPPKQNNKGKERAYLSNRPWLSSPFVSPPFGHCSVRCLLSRSLTATRKMSNVLAHYRNNSPIKVPTNVRRTDRDDVMVRWKRAPRMSSPSSRAVTDRKWTYPIRRKRLRTPYSSFCPALDSSVFRSRELRYGCKPQATRQEP